MNRPANDTTLSTGDIFRAAHLLCKCGKFKEIGRKDGQSRFVIEGTKEIVKEDVAFRTGNAFVNPLALRESYYLLKELSEAGKDTGGDAGLLEVCEDEERDTGGDAGPV